MLLGLRRDLPAQVRDLLAADADVKVAKSVAPHPGLPEALLRDMVDRYGVQVLASAAANPGASGALLEDLALHEPPAAKALRVIARHPQATPRALPTCLADRRARHVAAGHPALAAPVVAELLSDDDPRTAEAAAANPSLDPAVMSALVP